MDAAELAERKDEVQIVDVRYPNEWQAGHIQGAVHLPEDYLVEHLEELDQTIPVVAVCRSGSRSQHAAALLQEHGFPAENLDGGLVGWLAQGLPLQAENGEPGGVVDPEPPVDDRPEEIQHLQSSFLDAIFAVQEHFGDRQPSEDELEAFFRDRLKAEGKTPAEVDAFFAEMQKNTGGTTITADHAQNTPQTKES